MMVGGHVKIDLSGLEKFRGLIDRGLRGRSGPIRRAIGTWPEIYGAEMESRFVRMSRGGWAPLRQSTIYRRRHARVTKKGTRYKSGATKRGKRAYMAAAAAGVGSTAILRDTGTLFGVVSASFRGAPGALRKDISCGIRVGFGGGARYKKGRSKASIADIAAFHQFGMGHNPRREILVDPSQRTVDKMSESLLNGVRDAVRESDIGRT